MKLIPKSKDVKNSVKGIINHKNSENFNEYRISNLCKIARTINEIKIANPKKIRMLFPDSFKPKI